MNRSAFRAVIRYLKIGAFFKDYLGRWNLMVTVLLPLAIFLSALARSAYGFENVRETLGLFIVATIAMMMLGLVSSGYNDVISGKRLHLRLLPNGYFIYGTATFISFALFTMLVVAVSCGIYLLFQLGSGWQWALKMILVATVLLLSLMPWAMLISALIRGTISFLVSTVTITVVAIFIGPMLSKSTDVRVPLDYLSYLNNLYYPLKVIVSWCTGNYDYYAIPDTARALTAFGFFIGLGLLGYVLLAVFYKRLIASTSISSTIQVQAMLGKTTKSGKGW